MSKPNRSLLQDSLTHCARLTVVSLFCCRSDGFDGNISRASSRQTIMLPQILARIDSRCRGFAYRSAVESVMWPWTFLCLRCAAPDRAASTGFGSAGLGRRIWWVKYLLTMPVALQRAMTSARDMLIAFMCGLPVALSACGSVLN